MTDYTNTPQSDLVRSAAKIAGPQVLLNEVIGAMIMAGADPSTIALLPVAGKYIVGLFGQPGDNGAAALDAIMAGDWQTMLGLPDSLAQAVALDNTTRALIAEALLGVAAGVVTTEAQRLTALAQVSTSLTEE